MSDTPDNPKGEFPLLAEALKQVLKDRQWSQRAAGMYTGVHYNTIGRMKNGQNVEAEAIARFAFHISKPDQRYETVLHWLKLAKKDDFVSILDAVAAAARRVPNEAKQHIELPDGRTALVLPSGREFEPTPENLALLDTILTAFDQAKKQTQ